MKRTFEIEWDDSLGDAWMNTGNLLTCLNTQTWCADGLIISVKDTETGFIDKPGDTYTIECGCTTKAEDAHTDKP